MTRLAYDTINSTEVMGEMSRNESNQFSTQLLKCHFRCKQIHKCTHAWSSWYNKAFTWLWRRLVWFHLLTRDVDQTETERNHTRRTHAHVHTCAHAHMHTDGKTKTNSQQTQRASMQAGINQSSSQADEVYFTLKEWPTLCSSRDH